MRRKRPDLEDEDVAAMEEPPLGKRRRKGADRWVAFDTVMVGFIMRYT